MISAFLGALLGALIGSAISHGISVMSLIKKIKDEIVN